MKNFLEKINLYIKVYLALVRFSLSKSMEFRFDFFFRFIMDCFFYAISFLFFEIIFLSTNTLAGWQKHEVYLFVSGGLLIDGLYMSLIARNIWDFPPSVNQGLLDAHIIKPISTFFLVITKHFELASLLNAFVALGLMIYSISLFPTLPSFLEIAGFIFLLFTGLVLMTCLKLLTALPVFWTHSEFGFNMLFMSLEKIAEKPDAIFRGFSRFIFTTVLPFLVVTSFPARCFFGKLTLIEFFYALGITGFFIFVIYLTWKNGLRIYGSASS